MGLNAAFALLLLVLPALNAYPADDGSAPAPRDECDLNELQVDEDELWGMFEDDDWIITFSAVLHENTIYSTTALQMKDASSEDVKLTSRLAFPNTKDRVIPEMEKLVVEAAAQIAESTTCSIPDGLSQVYENLADSLYRCTKDMGASQLRFSVMYHETIVSSAKRLCSGADTICTPSPKYVYGNGVFICSEDMEELFPEGTQDAKMRMEEMKQRKREDYDESRDKRWSAWCYYTGCGGLEGTDWGCCSNYYGCCTLCHWACLAHDAICTCCSYWYCGWACQPDWWC